MKKIQEIFSSVCKVCKVLKPLCAPIFVDVYIVQVNKNSWVEAGSYIGFYWCIYHELSQACEIFKLRNAKTVEYVFDSIKLLRDLSNAIPAIMWEKVSPVNILHYSSSISTKEITIKLLSSNSNSLLFG